MPPTDVQSVLTGSRPKLLAQIQRWRAMMADVRRQMGEARQLPRVPALAEPRRALAEAFNSGIWAGRELRRSAERFNDCATDARLARLAVDDADLAGLPC